MANAGKEFSSKNILKAISRIKMKKVSTVKQYADILTRWTKHAS